MYRAGEIDSKFDHKIAFNHLCNITSRHWFDLQNTWLGWVAMVTMCIVKLQWSTLNLYRREESLMWFFKAQGTWAHRRNILQGPNISCFQVTHSKWHAFCCITMYGLVEEGKIFWFHLCQGTWFQTGTINSKLLKKIKYKWCKCCKQCWWKVKF